MNAPLIASLMDAGIAAGVVAILALPALFRGRAMLALLAIALAFMDDFITDWGHFKSSPLDIIHGSWNWSGKLFDLAALLVVSVVFIATGFFKRQEFGLTLRQKPGTLRAVLFVVVPFIAIIDLAVLHFASHDTFTTEDVAFQMTMPGFTEELFYRGLLLALFDRMFAPNVTVLGAKMGYGAIATSLAFASVHAIGVNRSLHVSFEPLAAASPLVGAFFGAWIRARSGSLVVPVLAHNISNTIVTIVPAYL
jgi:membrane protease YdiL (CAAX protease family)